MSVLANGVPSVASLYRPERWDDLPEAVSNIPGVWSHTLAFLGGPRACIGYRFALAECVSSLHTVGFWTLMGTLVPLRT